MARKTCYVCGVQMLGVHGHHVMPQSRGGRDGPQANVCGACHGLVHGAVTRMKSGRSPDEHMAHLPEDARERAMQLIHIALASERLGIVNPHPLLSVSLPSPEYMRALDLFKADRGFTSRDKAVVALLHELGTHYGLFGSAPPGEDKPAKTMSIGRFRGGGPT